MKKYDFILLEWLYWNKSHYQQDLKNLAELLLNCGFKVAVVNYLENNKYHSNQKYDVINLKIEKKLHNRNWLDYKSKITRSLMLELENIRIFFFFRELFKKIKNLSDNFYFGTLTLQVFPLLFIGKRGKRILFWGLRSFYVNKPFYFKPNPLNICKSIILKKILSETITYFLIVSNRIIKNEFKQGGFSEKRLIQRPERIIDKLTLDNLNQLDSNFSLLTIGFIRRDKNIHFAVEALKEKNINYIIAGESNPQYNREIDILLKKTNNPKIVRINKFFKEDEYHNLIKKSHFMVFCDLSQASVVSNGTLLESLLDNRPIICPDRLPYSYYIDKYRVGIKYNPGNKKSFLAAVCKAQINGTKYYQKNIKKFQENYLQNNVIKQLKIDLTKCHLYK